MQGTHRFPVPTFLWSLQYLQLVMRMCVMLRFGSTQKISMHFWNTKRLVLRRPKKVFEKIVSAA